MTKTTLMYIALIIGVVALVFAARFFGDGKAGATTIYDDFAQCLADSGAVFYGAYWCPHCNDQKDWMDNSSNIPYVECSTPDGRGQIQECADEGITGYPTWKFSDGTEASGAIPLVELAEKTGCELPE